jgi:putative ABC transport system ATP-binding protein
LNERGLTIVLVTHEHDIAQFAKRLLTFRDGKIRKDETFPTLRGRRMCCRRCRRSKTDGVGAQWELRGGCDALRP